MDSPPIPQSCQRRHHSWDPSPTPGAKCRGCGKEFAARAARAPLGAERARDFAVAMGLPPPAPPPPAIPPPTAQGDGGPEGADDEPSPASTRLWGRVSHRLTQVFVSGTGALIERLGREPNDPDPEDVNDFESAFGECLSTWFPDTALGPGKQMILSGVFIAGGMWHNAPKKAKDPPKPSPSASPVAPVAATTGRPNPLPDLPI